MVLRDIHAKRLDSIDEKNQVSACYDKCFSLIRSQEAAKTPPSAQH